MRSSFFAFSRAAPFFTTRATTSKHQYHYDGQQACIGSETPDACLRHARLLTLPPGHDLPTPRQLLSDPPADFCFLLLHSPRYSAPLEVSGWWREAFWNLALYGLEEVDSEGGAARKWG